MSFVMDAVGIDGLEDMKPTSGITAVGRKDRKEKEGKVRVTEDSMNDFSVWLSYLSCIVLIEVSDAADVKKEQWVLKRGICLQRGDKVIAEKLATSALNAEGVGDEAAGTALVDQLAGGLAAHAASAAAAGLGERQAVAVHGAADALRTLGAGLVEVEVAPVAPVAIPVAGDAAP
ncbi:hypothetical protein GW17_00018446, partial [Ensete ventricosum]